MSSVYDLLFKRALDERLEEHRKRAFVPMDAKTGQQAAGPGGAPVDPMAAGGAPPPGGMPPGGGAPMDPMAMLGGMPPGGAPPMDPMAAGAAPPPPPGGAPPGGDPLAALGGLPPLPGGEGGMPPEEEPPPGAGGGEGDSKITPTDAKTFETIQQNTMEIVRQTLEMVGKAKPREEQSAETAANVAKLEQDTEAATPPPPGPVTGQPVNTEAAGKIPGPLKLSAAKTSSIIHRKTAMDWFRKVAALSRGRGRGFDMSNPEDREAYHKMLKEQEGRERRMGALEMAVPAVAGAVNPFAGVAAPFVHAGMNATGRGAGRLLNLKNRFWRPKTAAAWLDNVLKKHARGACCDKDMFSLKKTKKVEKVKKTASEWFEDLIRRG